MPKIATYSCFSLPMPHLPKATDPVWEKAPRGQLAEVESGREPFLATEFRILRDDAQQALFLRFQAQDDAVLSTYKMHQETLYTQDVFELFIADGNDLFHYKEIEVSPYDLHFTGKIAYEAEDKINLDMGWYIPGFETFTRFDPKALQTASVWRLPYAAFDRLPKGGDSWRFNVFRIDHSVRGEELQAWQPTGKRNFHVPEKFGALVLEK